MLSGLVVLNINDDRTITPIVYTPTADSYAVAVLPNMNVEQCSGLIRIASSDTKYEVKAPDGTVLTKDTRFKAILALGNYWQGLIDQTKRERVG